MSKILKEYKAVEKMEGGGVKVNRVFGYGQTQKFDPFLMLDYFESNSNTASNGFPWHPHKGIETITYMLRGKIEHQDTLGNKGVIGPGGIQWMTAGKGIMHQEMPLPSTDGYQGFQFWLNLPSSQKLVEPKYENIEQVEMNLVHKDGITVNIISGEYDGVTGPIDKSDLGISLFHFKVKKNNTIILKRDQLKQGFIFVFKGEGDLNTESVIKGSAYTLSDGEFLLNAKKDMEFIYAEGTPLNEKIAWYGPIVMNTDEEIRETINDLQNGTFIKGDIQ